ncbi:ribosomal protein S18-alanine N-acetyltransferase [Aminithiophilus ramosus]|uniref:[Ribosomal protein bS18]-alanine N-acetyltransferase n=2 Tax=Synergistales TaxID=649776 RepID=A0A9Q7EX15_9BACT|nr:ribosomal protein S18-alanine N-acetyltransferase [Aminithiophilus ramosus]QTX33264.1 ribosomal protein S18-alanine N-acetyltransferase [Aminithiophilus ramosus]QVL36988.1 ribosomal protein S18-alanine N-acetyltransferase [Synergistota bacterium]
MLLVDIDFCDLSTLDEIYAIERLCNPTPWERAWIEKDLSLESGLSCYLGAWRKKCLIGFGACKRQKKRLYIMNLAVHPDYRRKGIASQLLLALCEIGLTWEMKAVALDVREGNADAQSLYRAFGFRVVGRTRGYYNDGEDSYVMMTSLPLDLG